MRDFIVYHHPDKMPYGVTRVSALFAVTDKEVSEAVGSRVWVVGREGKRYFIGAVFRAESETPGTFGFAHRIEGRSGHTFADAAEIGTTPWFPALRQVTGNFQFGFTEITDPHILAGLTSSAHQAGCASLP
jgi:hypothetical protein